MKNILNKIKEINSDIYLISDTHFYHQGILNISPSRLTMMQIDGYGYSVNDHEHWLTDNWNSIIKKDDTVLFLGDFAFNYEKKVLDKLNGKKIMILGNHDKKLLNLKWQNAILISGIFIEDNNTIIHHKNNTNTENNQLLSAIIKTINGIKYMFTHYDIFTDDIYDLNNSKISSMMEYLKSLFFKYSCDKLIHGHTHAKFSKLPDISYNVSVEHIDYRPIQLKKLIKYTVEKA